MPRLRNQCPSAGARRQAFRSRLVDSVLRGQARPIISSHEPAAPSSVGFCRGGGGTGGGAVHRAVGLSDDAVEHDRQARLGVLLADRQLTPPGISAIRPGIDDGLSPGAAVDPRRPQRDASPVARSITTGALAGPVHTHSSSPDDR